MQEVLKRLVERKKNIEEGMLPFVEPNSIEEEKLFEELLSLSIEINEVIKKAKGFALVVNKI